MQGIAHGEEPPKTQIKLTFSVLDGVRGHSDRGSPGYVQKYWLPWGSDAKTLLPGCRPGQTLGLMFPVLVSLSVFNYPRGLSL